MVKNQSTCNRIIFGGLIFLFEALYAIFQVFSDTPMVWWWKSRFGKGITSKGRDGWMDD